MKRQATRREEAAKPHKARTLRSIAVPNPDVIAPAESLEEAESEIGINDWIDPETGELAEGQSPPHLQDD